MPTKVEKDDITGHETTGHEWDGIKELNRPLPKWWLYTFYASIVYAFIYWVLYPSWPYVTGYFGGVIGGNQRVALDERLAEARAARAGFFDRIRTVSPEEILADPELFTAAPLKFQKATDALVERQEALSAAEEEWLDLAERAEGA